MKPRYIGILGIVSLSLTACATPQVDKSASSYDDVEYSTDLNTCRGGNMVEASAKTIGIAMLGSAFGALNGASIGILSGNWWEGAAIGAAVGGTIGIGVGAVRAIDKYEAGIAGCLRDKGYVLNG